MNECKSLLKVFSQEIYFKGLLFNESRPCGLEDTWREKQFEFLVIKIQISFSRHTYSSPQGRLS